MEEYVVQAGDTLSSIAAKKLGDGNRWTEIAQLNNLQNPNLLFVGQSLMLPVNIASAPQRNLPIPSMVVTTETATQQIPASVALARGYLFVVFEQLPEVGARKVIRKVAAIPKNYALQAPNPQANVGLAEHALGNNNSQYLSSSSKPYAAGSIKGEYPLLIDLKKAQEAGANIYTVEELVADLRRFASQNPASQNRVNTLIWAVQNVEGEVLIEGGIPGNAVSKVSTPHGKYIRTAEDLWTSYTAGKISQAQLETELATIEKAYSRAKIFGRVGRVLTVVGVIFTVKDVADATQRSLDRGSIKPLEAEVIRQVGGWGGAIVGGKIGFAAGALFGIETGPGAIVTGAIGAVVFGALGYFCADLIADWMEKEAVMELHQDSIEASSIRYYLHVFLANHKLEIILNDQRTIFNTPSPFYHYGQNKPVDITDMMLAGRNIIRVKGYTGTWIQVPRSGIRIEYRPGMEIPWEFIYSLKSVTKTTKRVEERILFNASKSGKAMSFDTLVYDEVIEFP